ncbi:MAG TPA: hypothetical protein DHW39_03530 [Erysipelotrichaceae bacterium]|nr:hypothetical protein [Erysipelotrichaceae bacterium]
MKTIMKIKLADVNFEVQSEKEFPVHGEEKYRSEEIPSEMIRITENDLIHERASSEQKNVSDALLYSTALYRKIAEAMIDHDTLLFHGSVVCMDGNAYMFCADSGTGKSTHARMWREYYQDRVFMINDDKPLISVKDTDIRAWGTPWSGKHHLDTNTSAPLKGICFLERDTVNHIERISEDQALPCLLKYSYRSSDPARVQKSLALLVNMAKRIPVYTLGCNISHEAAVTAYEGMKKYETEE